MDWQDVINDETLQDLPYKIETNKYGDIVMSPASNEHGFFQGEIVSLFKEYIKKSKKGKSLTECSVETPDGVKVADIAWLSNEFYKRHKRKTPYKVAPEICVEIISPFNTKKKIAEKMRYYFSKGAKEVWICDKNGNMTFHTKKCLIKKSKLIPSFPNKIEI